MHDFARWDIDRNCLVNDHVAEYEFNTDEEGSPTTATGRSRVIPQ